MTPASLGGFEWFAIFAVGLVTLATRVGGVYLRVLIPETPFWQRFFEHVPTALLVAIAMPYLTAGDWRGAVAAWCALVLGLRLPFFVAMLGGMAVVAGLRALI